MKFNGHAASALITVVVLVLAGGCTAAGIIDAPGPSPALNKAPLPVDAELAFSSLALATAPGAAAKDGPPKVAIIVHPAYARFFHGSADAASSGAQGLLIRRQMENEARFIEEQARSGAVVVLVLPADSQVERSIHAAYAAYLNSLVKGSSSAFYVYSRTANNGALSMDEMLTLYRFLASMGASEVMIGGGYVGRCQEGFYKQFVNFFEAARTYIVPEISTISPADVSAGDAAEILDAMDRRDYGLVQQFIHRKTEGRPNVLSLSLHTSR